MCKTINIPVLKLKNISSEKCNLNSGENEESLKIREIDQIKGLATTQGFFKHPNLNNFVKDSMTSFNKTLGLTSSIKSLLLSPPGHTKQLSNTSNLTERICIINTTEDENISTSRAIFNVYPIMTIEEIYVRIQQMPHYSLSKDLIKDFLTSPLPIGKALNCNIIRKIIGKDQQNIKYYVYLDSNDKFIFAAHKHPKKNKFKISIDHEVIYSVYDKDFLSKIKSNYLGTEFNIYSTGKNHKQIYKKEDIKNILGTVKFEVNFFGLRKPKNLMLYLPELDSNEKILEIKPLNVCSFLIN